MEEWSNLAPSVQDQLLAHSQELSECQMPYKQITQQFPRRIDVDIEGGYCMAVPSEKVKDFASVSVSLDNYQCRTLLLHAAAGAEYCMLKLCYQHGNLYLDCAAKRHFATTVVIPNNPLWQKGFTYQGFHSTGVASLSSAKVTVREKR